MQPPVAAYLDGGRRLHLQHGPIDLIVGAEGTDGQVSPHAFEAAAARFQGTLEGLASELPYLRRRLVPGAALPSGPVARRMTRAAMPYAGVQELSPMIAVAGSVADDILAEMVAAVSLSRAYVNNGGDIAVHVSGEARYDVAIAAPDGTRLGTVRIGPDSGIGGIATSGAGGRSFSLGIADSVTVLAGTAAGADAAATLIANTVDLPGHPGIRREPACVLQPDNDLGERLVVTRVPTLSGNECETALARGRGLADDLVKSGHIAAAALFLQGRATMAGRRFLEQIKAPEVVDV